MKRKPTLQRDNTVCLETRQFIFPQIHISNPSQPRGLKVKQFKKPINQIRLISPTLQIINSNRNMKYNYSIPEVTIKQQQIQVRQKSMIEQHQESMSSAQQLSELDYADAKFNFLNELRQLVLNNENLYPHSKDILQLDVTDLKGQQYYGQLGLNLIQSLNQQKPDIIWHKLFALVMGVCEETLFRSDLSVIEETIKLIEDIPPNSRIIMIINEFLIRVGLQISFVKSNKLESLAKLLFLVMTKYPSEMNERGLNLIIRSTAIQQFLREMKPNVNENRIRQQLINFRVQ